MAPGIRGFLSDHRTWLLRHGLALGCLALVLAFALLHEAAPHLYVLITRIPDGVAKPRPFVDLHAILQGGACWRQGVDVYRPSACLWGGVFNYSPLLLRAAYLPIGPQDWRTGGLLFCAAYGWALTRLPAPADGRTFAFYAAAAFSPAAYYALEQGNLDTLIFAATVLALGLGWRHRLWAYGIFALGAAAKFYPVALFALALRESRHVLRLLACAGAVAGMLAVAFYGHDLLTAATQLPSGTPFRASFGRIDLPRGLVRLHMLPWGGAEAWSWVLVLGALGLARWWRKAWANALALLGEAETGFLIAGAAVILFCFLAAQNIEYRAIFLILTLPALRRLAPLGTAFRVLPWVILLLLWEAVPRAAISGLEQPYVPGPLAACFWLLREALWWGVIAAFLALALAFVTREADRLRGIKLTQPGKILK